jgi:hypothetical protein
MPNRTLPSPSALRATALLALALALPIAWAHAGPAFAPGQRLYLVKTEHFDIIFSERSRPSALLLASFAEDALAYVEGELSLSLPSRVPVAITPDVGSFNGSSNPFPFTHIVIYDAPLDPAWTAFEDNLRGIFVHELTHAVSLQSRASWADFLSGVFGSWVSPALVNAPQFMVEGATVGLEGEGGPGGRAADPLVKERVRQDIRENRFKSPLECEGVYDAYPGGNLYYEYGGLFTAYLLERYGEESYAELWKALGNLISSLSLDPYKRGFFKAFEKTYGLGFEKAWADFREAMAIPGIVDAPERVGPAGPQYIAGLASGGGSLFWIDGISGRALRLDAASGRTSALFDADSSCAVTDAADDGSRLLVSRSLALPDGRDRVETAVYDVSARRFVPGSSMPGLREARFFRDGVVGVASSLHDSDLALERDGERRVLLSGSDGVMYSSPAVLDDRRVALIVSVRAVRSVGVLDVDSGELELIRPQGGPEGGGARLFDYARQLSASGGRLWFNFDSDDRLYKLGVVEGLEEGGSPSIRVEDEDWSGGVFWPVEAEDRVYYVGRFSEGLGLCRAPGAAGGAPGAAGGAAGGAAVSGAGGRAGGERTIGCSLERFDPSAAREEEDRSIAEAGRALRVEPYRPLAYANPFRFWIPYVDLGAVDRSFRPFALFYLGDPIDDNMVVAAAGYDSAYPMADLGLEWINVSLPVALDLSISDGLSYGASGPPKRLTSAEASASLSLPLFPRQRSLDLGLGGQVFAWAGGASGSPYEWKRAEPSAVAWAQAGLRGRTIGPWQNAGRGLDLTGWLDLELDTMTWKTEACLTASYDRPALRLDLWGAWAGVPILELDAMGKVFSSDRRPAYYEYADSGRGAVDSCYQGTAWWRLADQPIRSGLLGLYLNRLILDAGYRGAYFGGEYLQSCFSRASMDVSAGAGAAGAAGLRFYVEAFARLDGTPLEKAVAWRFGGTLRGDAAPALRGAASSLRRAAREDM